MNLVAIKNNKIVKVKKLNFKKHDIVWGYMFVAPYLLLFLIFYLYPIIKSVWMSFFQIGYRSTEFVGLKNYVDLLNDITFKANIFNTYLFVFINVPVVLILAFILANILVKKSSVFSAVFRGVFFLPIVSSQVVMALIFSWIYMPVTGFSSFITSILGIKNIFWLSSPGYARIAILIPVFMCMLGNRMIIYLAAIGGIDKVYYEASEIDGAGSWQNMIHITIPFLRPATTYLFIVTTIASFQLFAFVRLLTSGGPNNSTATVMYRLYETAFIYGKLGLASAMGVILAFMICMFSIFQFRRFKAQV